MHGFTENIYKVLIDHKGGGDEEKVGDREMKDGDGAKKIRCRDNGHIAK